MSLTTGLDLASATGVVCAKVALKPAPTFSHTFSATTTTTTASASRPKVRTRATSRFIHCALIQLC